MQPFIWVGFPSADVDPTTWNIDPADVERKITPKTKALVVSWAGLLPIMDPIMEIAARHNLMVAEDSRPYSVAIKAARPEQSGISAFIASRARNI